MPRPPFPRMFRPRRGGGSCAIARARASARSRALVPIANFSNSPDRRSSRSLRCSFRSCRSATRCRDRDQVPVPLYDVGAAHLPRTIGRSALWRPSCRRRAALLSCRARRARRRDARLSGAKTTVLTAVRTRRAWYCGIWPTCSAAEPVATRESDAVPRGRDRRERVADPERSCARCSRERGAVGPTSTHVAHSRAEGAFALAHG